jgi:hypothetical protein
LFHGKLAEKMLSIKLAPMIPRWMEDPDIACSDFQVGSIHSGIIQKVQRNPELTPP